MRHALVIARRELAEKRFVMFAAAAFAVLPFLVAMIPAVRSTAGSGDVIVVAAGLLCIGFTLALALALGVNVIGRDLSENRLSFYFARPVGAASIWLGKVAAGIVLIALSFAIILLPARIAGGAKWNSSWGGNASSYAVVVLGLAVFLFFAAHVVGSFVRSRSAWVAADFAAFVVSVLAVVVILKSMFDADAARALTGLAIGIGSGVLVALVGGGAWQLARGRTDRKRSHLALSQFVWGVIGATLAVAGAYYAWLVSATPNDLEKLIVSVPRPGSWIILGGQTKARADYRATFVYNLDSGAYSRIPAGNLWRSDLTADGKTLVLARANRRTSTIEILERPVERNDERPTGLTLNVYGGYVTSENGEVIAAVDRDLLVVYDVPGRRSLGSARLPEHFGTVIATYFPSPAVVRVFSSDKSTIRIHDFDVEHRVLRPIGELATSARTPLVSGNADGSRFLVRVAERGILIIDGRTAAVQATLPPERYRDAAFLHDGRIAATRDGAQSAVDILGSDATLVRSIPLPVQGTWQIHEMRDGRLVLPGRAAGKAWETFFVDPASGAVQRVPAIALAADSWYRNDPRRSQIDAPKFFFADEHLIRWNYATWTPEVILPRASS